MWRPKSRNPASHSPSIGSRPETTEESGRQQAESVEDDMHSFAHTDLNGRYFIGVRFGSGAKPAFGMYPDLNVFRTDLRLQDFVDNVYTDFPRLIQSPTDEAWLEKEAALARLQLPDMSVPYTQNYPPLRPGSPFGWEKPHCQNYALARYLMERLRTVFVGYDDTQLANIYYLSTQASVGNPTYNLWTFLKVMVLSHGYSFRDTGIVDPQSNTTSQEADMIKQETIAPSRDERGRLLLVKRLSAQCHRMWLPDQTELVSTPQNPLLIVELEMIIPLRPSSPGDDAFVHSFQLEIKVSHVPRLASLLDLVKTQIKAGAIINLHKTSLSKKSTHGQRVASTPPRTGLQGNSDDDSSC